MSVEVNAADIPLERLERALARTNLTGTVKAATGLLVADGAWLERPAFLDAIDVTRMAGGVEFAWIDFDRAVDLTGDPGQLGTHDQALLKLACQLAGRAPGLPRESTLMWVLPMLAESNRSELVVEAIGWALSGNSV